MDLNLKDKVIMVAAASKGLGFGIAEAVAREGARVSIASRTGIDIENAATGLQGKYKTDVRGYTFDATDPVSIENWTTSTQDYFGGIDGLVVNAGGPAPGKFEVLDDNAWNQAYELTLLSAVRMIRAVLPAFSKQAHGSIITITSTSIKEPIENLILSNVFRSGVVSLVKTLSRELAGKGVRINNLVPGRIDTERVRSIDNSNAERFGITVEEHQAKEKGTIPLGRYGSIEEIGSAAAYLLSDASGYINGATLVVDGGKTRTVW